MFNKKLQRVLKLKAEAYGRRVSIKKILKQLTIEEIKLVFDNLLESLLQEGRI